MATKDKQTLSTSDVATVNANDLTKRRPAALANFDVTASIGDAVMDAIANWEEEQVGFPPYWNPDSVGNIMMGKVMMKDETDPNFTRYVFQATKVAIPCKRGPSDGAEEVLVQPGEFFTMSTYAALPLDRFFDCEIAVAVANKRKLPATDESDGRPRDLWEFKVMVAPETKKILAQRRADETKQLQAARTRATAQTAQA